MNELINFRKFLINLLLVQLLVFSAIIGSFLFSGFIMKEELAEQMSKVVSSQMKMGNNREAISLLSDLQGNHFEQIVLLDTNNNEMVKLPTNSHIGDNILKEFSLKELSFPIYYDLNKKNIAGTVKFKFNFLAPLPFAVIIWLFGVLMTLPISFRYKKSFESQMEIEKIKGTNRAIKNLAHQVRHDYKSPLQSIHCLAEGSKNLSDKEKGVLLRAVNRLKQIMNDLSKKNLDDKQLLNSSDSNDQPLVHILSSIKEIIDEKKIKINGAKNISFEIIKGNLAMSSYYSFKEADFQRILSNLIDNSIESISGNGNITVKVEKQKDDLQIDIIDNGKGILASLMKQVGQRGKSYGKTNGEGLGLFSAIERVKAWGGELDIQSEEHIGTQVKLTLPGVKNPEWALENISFDDYKSIELLDDDTTVHDRWSDILNGRKIGLTTFLEVESYFSWLKKKGTTSDPSLKVIDYDLGDPNHNGVDVINKVGRNSSVLVTNNYSEKIVQDIVSKYGIKMMPKTMLEVL